MANRLLLTLLIGFGFSIQAEAAAITFSWKGSSSTTWESASNWTASDGSTTNYPGSGSRTTDIVDFGVSGSSYTRQPTLSTSLTIASIEFGGGVETGGTSLTVNGATLTVGTITQDINTNGSANTTYDYLYGTGTINATTIQLGSGTNTNGSDNYFITDIATLNISGNVVIISNVNSNNGSGFRLENGNMYLAGQIIFNPVSSNIDPTNSTTSGNDSYFTINTITRINSVATTPHLYLSNANPVPSIPTPKASVNFYGDTGGTGYVTYTAANANILTTATAGFGTGGGKIDTSKTSYDNLIIQGTGLATVGGSTVGALKVAGDFDTYSPVTFSPAGASATNTSVGGNWNNTSTVTGGVGSTAISGNVVNSGTMNLSSGILEVGGSLSNTSNLTAGSGNITVDANVTNSGNLTMSSGSLTVGGNYTNSAGGTFTAGSGTVYFDGKSAQTLVDNSTAGTTFNNVTFNGATASSVSTISPGVGNFAVSPIGVLTMANDAKLVAGSTTVGGAAYLTLMSNTNSTSAVGVIPSTCSITGNVNVQRYITGTNSNYASYRLLSSPVNNISPISGPSNYISLYHLNKSSTVGGVTYNGIYTGGPGGVAGGFNATTVNPIIYIYNERLETSNAYFTSGKNVGISSMDITSSAATDVNTVSRATLANGGAAYSAPSGVNIPVGNGYIDYFIGPNTLSSPSGAIGPATITNVGFINQQNVKVYLWYTPGSGTGTGTAGQLSYTTPASGPADKYQGFNMVGNPYPCTISLAQVFADNPGIDNIYVLSDYNPNGQEYNAYTATGNSSPSPAYVVSGQGFHAHAKSAGQTLTFNENEKAPAQQLTGSSLLLGTPKQTSQPLTGLYMKMVKDSIVYDYCGIYFRSDWVSTFKAGDAIDIGGLSPQVYMSSYSSDGVRLSVNHQPDYTKGINVRLYADANTDGAYSLKIEGIRNIDTLYDIFLLDHYQKDSVNIRRTGSYAFNIYKSDSSSFGGSRFELSIRLRPLPPYQLVSFTAQKESNGIQLTWKTKNEANYTGFVLQKADGTQFNQLYSLQSDGGGAYNFNDRHPAMGSNTYRLLQTGITGDTSYSSPVTVMYAPAGAEGSISVYPNPVKDVINLTINQNGTNVNSGGNQSFNFNLSVSSIKSTTYQIKIMNMTGAVLISDTSDEADWHHSTAGLIPGTYVIQVINNTDKSLIGKAIFIKI